MNTAHSLLERYYNLIICPEDIDFEEWMDSVEKLDEEVKDFFKNKNPYNNEISTTGLGNGTAIKSSGNYINRH